MNRAPVTFMDTTVQVIDNVNQVDKVTVGRKNVQSFSKVLFYCF